MIYRVLYKRFLASTNQLAVVEEVIEADYVTAEDGVLFLRKGKSLVLALPLPAFLVCEDAAREPLDSRKGLVVP